MIGDYLGIQIHASEHLAPDQILVFRPSALSLPPPVITWEPRHSFIHEIRQIVRDGIQAAFPDLVLPPARPDPLLLNEWTRLAEARTRLMVLDPRAMVVITNC